MFLFGDGSMISTLNDKTVGYVFESDPHLCLKDISNESRASARCSRYDEATEVKFGYYFLTILPLEIYFYGPSDNSIYVNKLS